ncbi:enoyl-CoA hydratase/isomerase family protein [Halorarius halobius]|uniref:enoyl-CoA hydratase/isomerase family protein n=1 Tax=Halorarius halobius TaxID=2962671 RepID=UPI0020CDD1B7|nr:enoyl-CoA hydratase/isomerase family protein [Halorarius halobius]
MAHLVRNELDEEIVELVLNRPESLNALNKELLREIPEAVRRADSNDRKVIIFRGAGDAFTAGADLEEATQDDEGEDVSLFQELTRAVLEFDGIVIGQLHGYAIGGGLEFTLSFDLRYAAEGTTFKLTESEIGVTISNASTLLLPATVGLGTAKDLVFTSREVSATEADDIGLVTGVYEEAALQEQVRDVARDIVENKSTAALKLNKRGINRQFAVENALEYERLLGLEMKASRADDEDDIDWG